MASDKNNMRRNYSDSEDVIDAGFVMVEPEENGGPEATGAWNQDAMGTEDGSAGAENPGGPASGGYSYGPGEIPGSRTEFGSGKTDSGNTNGNPGGAGDAFSNLRGAKGSFGNGQPGRKAAGPGGPRGPRGPKAPRQPKTPRPPRKPGAGKAMGRSFLVVVLILIAVTFVQMSMYSIGETESVVLTTFGKASVVEEKGLHFKIPYVQKATRVDTTVKGIKIGYSENTDGKTVTIEHESIMITSDYNFIDCDFYVSYQVTDPVKYLYQSDEPDLIVKNIAMSCIRSTLSGYSVDTAITTGKAEIQSNVKSMIMAELEDKDIGITLVDASIQDVEPPTDEIIEAFTAVETAKQGKESSINQANAYRNEQIPAAEAEADRIKQEAEAKKTSRINEAKGQAARFEEEYAEYKNYPLITKQRMFMETMEDVLPKLKVIIDNGDGSVNKYYPINDLGAVNAGDIAAADQASAANGQ